jgi:hypothetical protein
LSALALSERDGVLLGLSLVIGVFAVVLLVALAGTVTVALQALAGYIW